MTQSFHELILGDVLIASFVVSAGLAMLIILLLRPLLAVLGLGSIFSAPPGTMLCLYTMIVALLVLVT